MTDFNAQMNRSIDHAQHKLNACIRLARDCSRSSWQDADNPTQAREYRRVSREAMQDAREWARDLRSTRRLIERMDDQRRAYGRAQRGEDLNPMNRDPSPWLVFLITASAATTAGIGLALAGIYWHTTFGA